MARPGGRRAIYASSDFLSQASRARQFTRLPTRRIGAAGNCGRGSAETLDQGSLGEKMAEIGQQSTAYYFLPLQSDRSVSFFNTEERDALDYFAGARNDNPLSRCVFIPSPATAVGRVGPFHEEK